MQKRAGTRLQKLINDIVIKILTDGKKINGEGRLTEKVCNKI